MNGMAAKGRDPVSGNWQLGRGVGGLVGGLRRSAWVAAFALFPAQLALAADEFVQGTNGSPDLVALNCSAGFSFLSKRINSFFIPPGGPRGYQREEKWGMHHFYSRRDTDEYYVTLPSHPAHPAVFLYTRDRDPCNPGTHTVGCGFGDAKAFNDQLKQMPQGKSEIYDVCFGATQF